MKKFLLLLFVALGFTLNSAAMTYEEAFDSVMAIPRMKGIAATKISGNNDLKPTGITDAQIAVWSGESALQTEPYGNKLYEIIGQLPVSEMIQGKMYGNSMIAIFAKKISNDNNRIIILSDSAESGFTGAIIGYINDVCLNQLRSAVLLPREGGGTAIYYNVMNF